MKQKYISRINMLDSNDALAPRCQPSPSQENLQDQIDSGEAEAIALALENRASLILLDDADAREKARLYQISITGTLGLLLRAKKTGKIASLSVMLDALCQTGFWLRAELIRRLLVEAGEKR